jgi:predicted PurR-regulated permease PerM
MNPHPDSDFSRSAPLWLRRVGTQSWLFIGAILAFAVLAAILAVLNDIVMPLIISVLIAILSRPLVDWLERHKVSRSLGTILTMILILFGIVGLVYIVIRGIVQQGPEIADQLSAGWINLQIWFSQFDIQLLSVDDATEAVTDALPLFFDGIFSFLGSTLSTGIALAVGIYFSAFSLFFFLKDSSKIQDWIAHRISSKPQVGAALVSDASQTVLIYFRGTALTAMITSGVIAIPLLILNVPLVGSILILYFFTSFIPYLGAWIAGAFAVLIALGAGGVETALIVLVAVIISNGILQSVVSSWALGSMLKMYPLVIFLVTIISGIVGGVLAMILAVPLTAIAIQLIHHLQQEGVFLEDGPETLPQQR